jgi:hypothetical protein
MEKDERGMLTLEAAIIIPIMLTLLIGFIVLMRIAVLELTLQTAAMETAKQLSNALYPFEQQLQSVGTHTQASYSEEVLELIPQPMKQIVSYLIPQQQNHVILQPLLNKAAEPVVWFFIPEHFKDRIIDKKRLHVEYVRIPHVNDQDGYFGVEISYELTIKLPFFEKKLRIHKRAYERVWFGA